MTKKQEAIKVISNLSENVNFEEIMYKLHILEQIYQGQEEVGSGHKGQ